MKKLLLISSIFILGIFSFRKITPGNQVNVNIGALLSITGNWSSLGITSKEAMNIAIKEINHQMELTGSHNRFTSVIYDTKLDTSLALQAVKEAKKNNITYLVGPQSSAELQAIRNYVVSNNMLVVSQASTAGSLGIAGDGIFRFCPVEEAETNAMAATIYQSGRHHLIALSRDDEGNKGLQTAIAAAFKKLGGTVDLIPPYPATTTDFSPVLSIVRSKILEHDTSSTAVYLSCFDRATDLFSQAFSDAVLTSVHWYGGDGITKSSVIITDNKASSFAVQTHFFSPGFGLPKVQHPSLETVYTTIKNRTGIAPDAYALCVYDAVWVIAQTINSFSDLSTDFQKIKEVFQLRANQFSGLTGPLALNEAGDRKTGSFDYWGIVDDGNNYIWKWVGRSND